jgi:hypothetical protein
MVQADAEDVSFIQIEASRWANGAQLTVIAEKGIGKVMRSVGYQQVYYLPAPIHM